MGKTITDAEGHEVTLNDNHGHPVCPACNGRSAGEPTYNNGNGCGVCNSTGTVKPKADKAGTATAPKTPKAKNKKVVPGTPVAAPDAGGN